jgi:6-pyruvoyltetrahydropterin/6-carboxytetrahydropterin synthase
VKLGIAEHVDCAHFLPGHPKCGRLHGHTYRVEVTITGDHRSGMVIDFADFKAAVRAVLAEFDHRSWNDVLDYPSVENICELLHHRLSASLAFPLTLRVFEGHGKFAEM